MEDLVRLSGGLCAVALAVAILMAIRGGTKAGLMELQLASDPEATRDLIPKEDDPRRNVIRRLITLDFFFIGAYWLAFGALAILLAHRGSIFVALAAAAILLGTAAALLDVVENFRTLGLLSLQRDRDQLRPEVLNNLRTASLAKWATSFLAGAALSALFWSVHWVAVLAGLLLVAALLGLYAVRRSRPKLIVVGFALQGLALLIAAPLFIGWPGIVLEAF